MLFIQPEYKYLLKGTDQVGEYEIQVRSQDELFLILHTPVVGKVCKVFGTLGASAQKVLELLLLCHTLKKEGALQVSLLSPYMGYSRQDHNEFMRSYGLKWTFDLLQAAGVDEVITIDIHEPLLSEILFTKSHLINISPFSLWEPYFYQYAQQGYSFVFPDKGAFQRYTPLHAFSCAYFEKKRTLENVEVVGMHGKMHQRVVIVDDILDSGKTLLQTCIALQKLGVKESVVFVTHGVFSDIAWHQIFTLGVKFIYCTNSLPSTLSLQHPCIKILSIRPMLEPYIL